MLNPDDNMLKPDSVVMEYDVMHNIHNIKKNIINLSRFELYQYIILCNIVMILSYYHIYF